MNFLVKNIVLPLLSLRAKKHKEIIAQAIASGIEIETSGSLLDYYLEKMNFVLNEGVLQKIESDDFVEIYDKYGVQLFRTFNVFKFSTHTLEELFTKRMDELYERPEFYNKMLFKAAYSILDRKVQLATNFCPDHIVTEKKSGGTSVMMKYKFMAPVFDAEFGDMVGVLVCENLKPLSESAFESSSEPQSEEPHTKSPPALSLV